MKKYYVAALLAAATLTSFASSASAQRYLDDYRGREINDVKDALRRDGYSDVGHITTRRGRYALMYDGRTCIALHGGYGLIDDIDIFDPRDCGARPRPPGPRPWGPPPPRY
jgi:hypothetical protein